MEYLKVIWTDAPYQEAVTWYCELDADRRETRKVTVFRDGHSERADDQTETGYTWLSKTPLPAFAEISAQGMAAVLISRADFESVWRKAQFDAWLD